MLLTCILEVPGFSVVARSLTILIGFCVFFFSLPSHTLIHFLQLYCYHFLPHPLHFTVPLVPTACILFFILSESTVVQSLYVPCCSFCPQYYVFPGHVSLIHICITYWLLSLSSKMTNVISVD